jgi:hypothetical protein
MQLFDEAKAAGKHPDPRNPAACIRPSMSLRWAASCHGENTVRSVASCFVSLALGMAASPADVPTVPYPDGYRNWHHVKTTVIQPGHPMYAAIGGINHTYANAEAMRGYQDGHFPDGAALVFDTIEARDADHAITEGKRKVIGVMIKDARRYVTTGGWGFENFDAGDPKRPVFGAKAATVCFGCHSRPGTRDHVYSHLRD